LSVVVDLPFTVSTLLPAFTMPVCKTVMWSMHHASTGAFFRVGTIMKSILKTISMALASVLLCTQLAEARTRPVKRQAAPPTVDVSVDISQQTMNVRVNGLPYATWKVSTARAGYYTPRGTFRAQSLARMHYSRKYDNAAMPNSVFFHYGYAIHATGAIRSLGRPASHGCVRLHPTNAAKLFALVQQHGMRRTRIRLVD
jgi:lipoprotein-anchoring transpeptidase ErfK/SrfK